MHGQTKNPFLIKPVELEKKYQALLEKKFTTCSAIDVDLDALNRLAEGENELNITLMAGEKIQLSLEEIFLVPNYAKKSISTPKGLIFEELDAPRVFQGMINNDPNQTATILLDNTTFTATLQRAGTTYKIARLDQALPHAPVGRSCHILYPVDPGNAGLNDIGCVSEVENAPGHDIPHEGQGLTEEPGDDLYLELAIETDNELLSKFNYPSNPTAIKDATNFILDQVAQMAALYKPSMKIHVLLVNIHFWENVTDPYSSNDITVAWNEFKGYWAGNQGCINEDVAMLISGREYGSSTYGYINWSAMNGVCNNGYTTCAFFAYGVVKYRPTLTWATLAHETAHTLGHPGTQCCTIMFHSNSGQGNCSYGNTPPCTGGPFLEFNSWDRTRIRGNLDNNSYKCEKGVNGSFSNSNCLAFPAPGSYDGTLSMSADQVIQGNTDQICLNNERTFTFFNDFDKYADLITWEVSSNLQVTSQPLGTYQITVKGTAFGPAWIKVTFPYNCGQLSYQRDFWVGAYPEGEYVGPTGPGSSTYTLYNVNFIKPGSYDVWLEPNQNVQYNWQLVDGAANWSATGNQTLMNLNIMTGSASFHVTEVNNCTDDRTFTFVVSSWGFSVSPNPATDEAVLHSFPEEADAATEFRVKLLDQQGTVLYETTGYGGQDVSLPLQNRLPGQYRILVHNGKELLNFPLIKQ